jgi:hypothetical protein
MLATTPAQHTCYGSLPGGLNKTVSFSVRHCAALGHGFVGKQLHGTTQISASPAANHKPVTSNVAQCMLT